MASINYLGGGGVQNVGTPVDHYKIIDERNNSAGKIEHTSKAKEAFTKALNKENTKINREREQEKGKLSSNKAVNKQLVNKASMPGNKNSSPYTKNMVNDMSQVDGTDLARMRKVAKDLTDQLYGFLWASMAEGVNQNPEGGFGEALFQKSLWPELVKNSTRNDPDELQEAIVRDLVKQQNNVK